MSARVLIAGGGVAGLEAAIALRELAGDRVEVEICSPREDFVYRPFAVGAPYGMARAMRFDIRRLSEPHGIDFRLDSIVAVDAEQRQALTHDGERLDYDYLVVVPGARMLWAVPGTVAFWGVIDEGGIQGVVRELADGALRSAAFTMPGTTSWALPVYELALLSQRQIEKAGVRGTRLVVVTPEDAPLEIFGRQVGVEVGELLAARGIEVLTGTYPVKYEGGFLEVVPEQRLEVDAAVSLPRLEGRRIEGVPYDAEGFVDVDRHCRVEGLERVFAAGDVTNFPVKQGGIATQQADAAAEAIAAELGTEFEPQVFDPVLRGVLWTGAEPRYLYGHLDGGHGETASVSDSAPWASEAEDKIIGRYLTPALSALR